MDYSDSPTPNSPNPDFPLREFLGFHIDGGDGAATASLELGEHVAQLGC